MKLKDKLLKVLLVFVLAGVAINLSPSSISRCEIENNTWACNPSVENNTWAVNPSVNFESQVWNSGLPNDLISSSNHSYSPLLGYLFQLMFILFFISPPLIAVILLLIWKELKQRNKMK